MLAFPIVGIKVLGSPFEVLEGTGLVPLLGHGVLDPIWESFMVEMVKDLRWVLEFSSKGIESNIILENPISLLHSESVEVCSGFRLWINCSEVIFKFSDKCGPAVKSFQFVIILGIKQYWFEPI